MSYDPFPDEFPNLWGDGLELRELCEADLPAWFERASDPAAADLAGDQVATSMDAMIAGLARHRAAFRERSGLRWAIVPDDLGASVGSVGFFRFGQTDRTAEIGISIGRAHWGRGIATRAMRIVSEYAFGPLELQSVEAVVVPENKPMLRILKKLGFGNHPQPGRDRDPRADAQLLTLVAGGADESR